MSSSSRWKKMLGRAKKSKIPVIVKGKTEAMTDTQAYRFEKLTNSGSRKAPSADANPLEDSTYTLEDAAFRLMTSTDDLLARAAAGSVRLYTSVAGLAGRWHRLDGSAAPSESTPRTLQAGLLALPVRACQELAARGASSVTAFDFPDVDDLSPLGIDGQTLQELAAWGEGRKLFCVDEAQQVRPDQVVLLAPLSNDSQDASAPRP